MFFVFFKRYVAHIFKSFPIDFTLSELATHKRQGNSDCILQTSLGVEESYTEQDQSNYLVVSVQSQEDTLQSSTYSWTATFTTFSSLKS